MPKLCLPRPNALTAALIFWLSTACTPDLSVFDQSGLQEVKRVALIGFSVSIRDDGYEASRRMQGLVDQGFGPKLYKVSQSQLSKGHGWQFASLQKVEQGSFYKTKAGKAVAQTGDVASGNDLEITVPHLLSSAAASALATDGKSRAKLAKELHVDSLLIADLKLRPNAAMAASLKGPKKAAGAELMLYKCTVTLQLYTRDQDEAVWQKHELAAETTAAPPAKQMDVPFASPRQAAVASACTNALKAGGDDH